MCVSGVRFIFPRVSTVLGALALWLGTAAQAQHLRTKVLCSDGSRCHLLIKPFEPWP